VITLLHLFGLLACAAFLGSCGPATDSGAADSPAADPAPQPAVASFDCDETMGGAASHVCREPALTALDRDLEEVLGRAEAGMPEEEFQLLRQEQAGWTAALDDCEPTASVIDCLANRFEVRITEIQIQAGLVEVPGYHAFDCDDGEPLQATFYANTRRLAAVLTRGDDQLIVPIARSGSGARYVRGDVSYWEHQGEVTLDWRGRRTLCRASGS
jgi:uncharacterized protein